MKRNLLNIKNNSRTMPKFDAFRTSFDNLPSDVVNSEGKASDSGKETMFKQMNIFFASYETTGILTAGVTVLLTSLLHLQIRMFLQCMQSGF